MGVAAGFAVWASTTGRYAKGVYRSSRPQCCQSLTRIPVRLRHDLKHSPYARGTAAKDTISKGSGDRVNGADRLGMEVHEAFHAASSITSAPY